MQRQFVGTYGQLQPGDLFWFRCRTWSHFQDMRKFVAGPYDCRDIAPLEGRPLDVPLLTLPFMVVSACPYRAEGRPGTMGCHVVALEPFEPMGRFKDFFYKLDLPVAIVRGGT